MDFENYRVRDNNFNKPPSPDISIGSSSGSNWILAIIDKKTCPLRVGVEDMGFNVTAIVYAGSRPYYFSALPLMTETPDFHSAAHIYADDD
jgi:hypothetical protein